MNFYIRYSSVLPTLEILKKIKFGTISKGEIEHLLKHDDYQFEFLRYKGRVNEVQFADYLFNLQQEYEIVNEDLRIQHRYYNELLSNLEYYSNNLPQLLGKLTPELFNEQVMIALKGLSADIEIPDLNFIFTFGIGQSFGYVYENGMHFDILHLLLDNSFDDFCATISHEVHHVGLNKLYETINVDTINLEERYFLYLAGEGLAVKYCNNADGVLTQSIYQGSQNIGLDSFTWSYLRSHFDCMMTQFKKDLDDIREGKIKTVEQLDHHFAACWMDPYIEGQLENEIPKLKQLKYYSFGNEIWGVIHDAFGKEKVYETMRNISSFRGVYNSAVEKIEKNQYKI